MTWNIGFLGAGPGVAALHIPTIARLGGLFRPVHFADVGSGRALALAESQDAKWSVGERDLFADPEVNVVAVCSPPAEHARQILAAVAAGKRAIFCEKPLATSAEEVFEVVAACRSAGAVMMVGTNHAHDPGWKRAQRLLDGHSVEAITVTLALPPNDRYHLVVSEAGPFQMPARGRPDIGNPTVAASVVKQLITGLAVHDLPAVRRFAPRIDSVEYARFIPPIGYAVGYRAGSVTVQLALTMLPAGPDALWRVTFSTSHLQVDLDYTPPFVHAGSGAVAVMHADGSRTEYPTTPDDGYEEEWRYFASLLKGAAPVDYDDILEDALYPLHVAEQIHAAMTAGVLR
ncbi:Gfo/Idh/MocA family oxidoreductase [Arthrobacter sp. Rue61a]|uniref:Gfo/Idh/MocA family protein n=1 Tax=Arthrobacter sp. Rue61a TaxID=1118963 RepID=UPI00027DFC15|nr:Gfo/Idh/MocA family oxidoreductase [Arthrobacter sp. Rue61a]AFR28690.1 hypothetical protein ARUE_c17840 [Arthrobacter sp. Rue61a]